MFFHSLSLEWSLGAFLAFDTESFTQSSLPSPPHQTVPIQLYIQGSEVNPFPTALSGFSFHVQPSLTDIKTLDGLPYVSCGNSYLASAIMFIVLDPSGFISLLFICELDKQNI